MLKIVSQDYNSLYELVSSLIDYFNTDASKALTNEDVQWNEFFLHVHPI